MPSPFPGMDPYLEEPDIWSDFHTTVLVAIRASLSELLPAGYLARIDRYVWLHEPDANSRRRLGKPDVFTVEDEAVTTGPALATIEAPSEGTLPAVRRKGNRFLRIVDRHERRVVTVLELLSPSNKTPGPDRQNYIAKRDEYLATGTNLVEIDLLRSGQRMPTGEPPPPPADFYIVVCRAVDFPRSKRWPFTVREPIPIVPVPLNPQDPVVSLALKPCIDRAYDEAHYGEDIDYRQQPVPPLNPADSAWAREVIATRSESKGKRS